MCQQHWWSCFLISCVGINNSVLGLVELNGPIANVLSTRWGFGPSRTLMDVMMRGWNLRTGIFCHPPGTARMCVCKCWDGRYGHRETDWPSMDRCKDERVNRRRIGRGGSLFHAWVSVHKQQSHYFGHCVLYLTAALLPNICSFKYKCV